MDFEALDLAFTIADENGEDSELVKDGKNVKVNKQNRKDYTSKMAQYYLYDSIKGQIEDLVRGFYQVIPHQVISVFDADELDFLISGI